MTTTFALERAIDGVVIVPAERPTVVFYVVITVTIVILIGVLTPNHKHLL